MTTMMFGIEGTASGVGACLHPYQPETTAHTEITMVAVRRIVVILHGPIREAVHPPKHNFGFRISNFGFTAYPIPTHRSHRKFFCVICVNLCHLRAVRREWSDRVSSIEHPASSIRRGRWQLKTQNSPGWVGGKSEFRIPNSEINLGEGWEFLIPHSYFLFPHSLQVAERTQLLFFCFVSQDGFLKARSLAGLFEPPVE